MLYNVRCNSYELLKKGLSSFKHDIFARETVLAVGVSPNSMAPRLKSSINLTFRKRLYNVRCNSYELLQKG